MRRLWTEPLVTFKGRWHTLDRIAIAPRPSRPIPIWLGTHASERLMRRVARLADGWMPLLPVSRAQEVIPQLHAMLEAEGRDPATFGLQVNVEIERDEPKALTSAAKTWQSLGATHIGVRSRYKDIAPMAALQNAVEIKNHLEAELG